MKALIESVSLLIHAVSNGDMKAGKKKSRPSVMLFYVFLGERTEQMRCIVDRFFLIFKKRTIKAGVILI